MGIETEDDVVRIAKEDEGHVYEQDKHSISDNIPFGDHSKDLWNTLCIWLKAASEPGFDLENTEFHLVTNKIVKNGLVVLIAQAESDQECEICSDQILAIATNVPEGIKKYANKVCEYDISLLRKIVSKIILCDGNKGSYGDKLKEEIKSLLHVSAILPFEEIYNSLLGWVHNTAMHCWRNNKPAWLSRDAFTEYYQKILSRYNLKRFIETDQSLISLSLVDKEAQYNELFVRQLYLLALEKNDDLLISSIEDYLRCNHERTRFSIEGDITKEEMDRFDQNLIERWRLIFAQNVRKYKRALSTSPDTNALGEDAGFEILAQTLDHRESLANQPTEQYYLTRGSYHRLANNKQLILGWHPEFTLLLKQGE
ncbi:ABC-three component system protein [Paenibacillus sp. GCM10012306]|uniref:ABC-three component system protein n=1 Tax=Paenibacillus sp. GCM10012306 TaxID=3317342 RepID=UPI003606B085